MTHIFASAKESLISVFPIAIIVSLLSITCVSLDAGVLVLFLFGTILLISGMSFFTLGSGMSMEPLGDGIGKSLNKNSKIQIPLAMGACEAVGGNLMTDAFGIVAMIAMTPLITIQVLGLYERKRRARVLKKFHTEISCEQNSDRNTWFQ